MNDTFDEEPVVLLPDCEKVLLPSGSRSFGVFGLLEQS